MSNENITPEIKEYADICRRMMVEIYQNGILAGKYDDNMAARFDKAMCQYRICLEIMKLEMKL